MCLHWREAETGVNASICVFVPAEGWIQCVNNLNKMIKKKAWMILEIRSREKRPDFCELKLVFFKWEVIIKYYIQVSGCRFDIRGRAAKVFLLNGDKTLEDQDEWFQIFHFTGEYFETSITLMHAHARIATVAYKRQCKPPHVCTETKKCVSRCVDL